MILDGNQLAEGHAFFAIGATDISDDGRWLAYTTDTTGFRQYTLHIKDLDTGETLPGEVERVGSVVWAADNRRSFTPSRTRSRSASTSFGGTRWARRTPRTCWSIRTTTSASTWARAARATANSS